MKSTLMIAALAAGVSAAPAPAPQAPSPSPMCDPFAISQGPKYVVNNNEWGKSGAQGQQCISVSKNDGDGVAWKTNWNWSGGDGSIMSYANAGVAIDKKLVSSVASIATTANWTYDDKVQMANVAYDLFTHTDPTHATTSGDFEIMVWLNRWGVNPKGKVIAPAVSVNDYHWDLWYGNDDSIKQATYTFVHTGDEGKDIGNVSLDIKKFFDELVASQKFPADKQYVLTLQFGSEIWKSSGDTTFTGQFAGSVAYAA